MSANPVQSHYDDGLQVVHYDAPETLSSHGMSDSTYSHELDQKFLAVPESSDKHLKFPTESDDQGLHPNTVASASRPWYKRKRILGLIASGIIILAIALGVGLGVGLTTGNDSSTGSDDEADGGSHSDKDSICKGGFCGQILSLNRHENGLYVLGRSADKTTIDCIRYDEEESEWESWEDLGTMSDVELLSPPASQNWPVNGTTDRLDVFAVGSRNGAVWNKWHSEEEGWGGWNDIGEGIGSPLATCFVSRAGFPVRLDVWGTDQYSGTTIKTHWRQWPHFSEDDFDGVTEDVGRYFAGDEWYRNDKLVSSTLPAVVCREDDDGQARYHEAMWYKSDGSLYHSYYSDHGNWREPQKLRGKWIGEPTLLSANDNNTDVYFFGVQEDHQMYYLKPEDLEPVSLGGKIISVPALRYIDDGRRVDIVALNSNGTLVHQHHDGVDWLLEWEELGIQASSAPGLRNVGDVLFIFAVNSEGNLMAWTLDSDVGSSWRDSLDDGENLGGELSLEYWTGNDE